MIDAIEPISGNSGVEPTPPVPPVKGSGTDGVVLSETAQATLLERVFLRLLRNSVSPP